MHFYLAIPRTYARLTEKFGNMILVSFDADSDRNQNSAATHIHVTWHPGGFFNEYYRLNVQNTRPKAYLDCYYSLQIFNKNTR